MVRVLISSRKSPHLGFEKLLSKGVIYRGVNKAKGANRNGGGRNGGV